MPIKKSCFRPLLLGLVVSMALTACSGGRSAVEYTNVWDQAFAQSMQGKRVKEGGI